jgi:hypothetical protein
MPIQAPQGRDVGQCTAENRGTTHAWRSALFLFLTLAFDTKRLSLSRYCGNSLHRIV